LSTPPAIAYPLPPLRRALLGSAAVALLASLWACSSKPVVIGEPQDGAPAGTVDVSRIADAVPRVEARSRYGNPPQYTVLGRSYQTMTASTGYVERGIASWYGTKFHGRRTSSGEPYDMYAMTAAHKTLPLPTYVRVTNLRNGRSVVVRVNDRGPFVKDRVIDLSYAAAIKLGVSQTGTAPVEVRAIDPSTPTSGVKRTDAAPAGGNGTIFLQVGAFAHRANAEQLRARLLRIEVQPVEIQEAVSRDRPVFRVRVGPLDVAQADRVSESLAQEGHDGVHIVVD